MTRRSLPPAAAGAAATALVAAVWHIAPAVVSANDCPAAEEIDTCIKQAFALFPVLGLLGASLAAIGMAVGRPGPRASPPEPDVEQPMLPYEPNFRTQNNAYDAGGINMHGGAGPDGGG